jgi:hypothetical protein
MNQFCLDVIEFLTSEYNDGYEFNIEVTKSLNAEDQITLTIKFGRGYYVKADNRSMMFIYGCYRAGEFLEDRGVFRWQKELVDLIEGS